MKTKYRVFPMLLLLIFTFCLGSTCEKDPIEIIVDPGIDWESRSQTEQRFGLSYADFDGDGKQEVFIASAGIWKIGETIYKIEQEINVSDIPFSSLAFGDFDGDGKTDVFKSGSGGKWWVSYGGTNPWQKLNVSSKPLSSLAFGDFDGDGKTDVFKSGGEGKWWVSYGGASPWQELNTYDTPLSSLRFADVNKDGSTDILYYSGNNWVVSYKGKSAWEEISFGSSADDQNCIHLGDWDGDSKPDSFGYIL